VLADERGDDQARRGARLDQAGDAEAGDQGPEAVCEAGRQDAAQVLAEHSQHAGANDVRSPDEERDRGEEIEKREHRLGSIPQAQGSEYVLTLVKLFIASWTPSL